MDFRKMVYDFHIRNGQPTPGVPTNSGLKWAMLRSRLIIEEQAETLEAIDRGDIVQVADGCADLLYVLYGTAVAFGVSLATPMTWHPLSNERLEIPPVHKLVREIINLNSATSEVIIALHKVENDDTILNHDLEMSLAVAVDKTCKLAWMFKIPLHRVFEEVHASNMTKEPLDKHSKGGKGQFFRPADVRGVIYAR